MLLNLLSVGAAYGLLVVVFQHGVGASLLGFRSNGAIIDWLPLFLFVILFGLSMDYHVFVVSRIREAHARGCRPARRSRTASRLRRRRHQRRAVMVAVFGVFATLSLLDFKQMGVGLAAAVLIDATVVRAVLLPSAMVLLGDATGGCRGGCGGCRRRPCTPEADVRVARGWSVTHGAPSGPAAAPNTQRDHDDETQPASSARPEDSRHGPATGALAGLLSLGAFLGSPSWPPGFVVQRPHPPSPSVSARSTPLRTSSRTSRSAPSARPTRSYCWPASSPPSRCCRPAGAVAARRLRLGLLAVGLLAVVAAVAAVSSPTGGWSTRPLPARRSRRRRCAPPAARERPARRPRRARRLRSSAQPSGAPALRRRHHCRRRRPRAWSVTPCSPTPDAPPPPAWGSSCPRPRARHHGTGRRPAGGGAAIPFYTPNDDFYRVDTALSCRRSTADDWSLRIHGMVDREIELDFDELLAPRPGRARHHPDLRLERGRRPVRRQRPLARRPAGDLLEEAGVEPGADQSSPPLRRRHDHRHPDRGASSTAATRCSPSA